MMTLTLVRCASLLPFVLLRHVSAVPWEGPRATGAADVGLGWTPLPTGTPRGSRERIKRAGQYPITVCGFIGGDLSTVLFVPVVFVRIATDRTHCRYPRDLLERIILRVVLRLQRHWVLHDFRQCLHGADHVHR